MHEYPPYDFPWLTLIFGISFQLAMNLWAVWWLLKKSDKPRSQDLEVLSVIGFVTIFVLSMLYISLIHSNSRHPSIFTSICGWLLFAQFPLTIAGMVFSVVRTELGSGTLVLRFVTNLLGFLLLSFLALCLPTSIFAHQEAAARTVCKNNLKQIGFSFHQYFDEHETLPHKQSGDPHRSWRVELLPYIGEEPLYQQYNQTVTWDSLENQAVVRSMLNAYTCPSAYPRFKRPASEQNQPAKTAYALPISKNTIFGGTKPLTFKQITDGSSNTFLVIEACGQNIPWAEPRDFAVTEDSFGINLPSPDRGTSPAILSSHHSGGAQVAMADGSVRFISQNIDPETLKLLVNARDGQVVGEW